MPKSPSCRFPEPFDPRFTTNALRSNNNGVRDACEVFVGDRFVELRNFDDLTPGPGKSCSRSAPPACAAATCVSTVAMSPSPASAATNRPGTVVTVGPVLPTQVAVGDRVMVASLRWLRHVPELPVGGKNEQHGGHAPDMKVSAASALFLPDALSFEAGGRHGVRHQYCVGAEDRVSEIGGQDLVVFDQGPVGRSVTLLAGARGARVIVDLSADRRDQAV